MSARRRIMRGMGYCGIEWVIVGGLGYVFLLKMA